MESKVKNISVEGFPSMPAPLCLVENSPSKGLVIIPQTVDIISKISRPFVSVAIVGPYRTGKSFLMNRLMGQNTGFPISSTLSAQTKGLWVWCRPHPTKPDHCLILFDSEGLGDVEKGDAKNDLWLFSLILLLSGTLVYNCLSVLQNDAIDKLHLVTQMTDLIQEKSLEGKDGKYADSPSFIWAVRDFTLELKKDGQPITADEYLEHALSTQSEATRNSVTKCFKDRKCFVFSRPAERSALQQIEKINDDKLDEDFVREDKAFCDHIYNHAPVKSHGGTPVTGKILMDTLKASVETLRAGNVPNMESTFDSVIKIQNTKAVENGLTVYKQIDKLVSLPTETESALLSVHQTQETKALETFHQNAYANVGEYKTKLQGLMKQEFQELQSKNTTASENRCKEAWNSARKHMITKISQHAYAKLGGYADYTKDKDAAISLYKATANKGFKAEKILSDFLSNIVSEENNVRETDVKITEEARKAAEAKRQAEEAETKRKLFEENRLKIEREIQIKKERDRQLREEAERRNKEALEKKKAELEQQEKQRLAEQKKRLETEAAEAVRKLEIQTQEAAAAAARTAEQAVAAVRAAAMNPMRFFSFR